MSHNSAGRLPYDSIVPRASLLDDRATRPPLRTGWPLASSTLRPRDRPRGRCLHVSAPLERNSFSSCKRLCITGRGITGYTRAWVVSRGAFFLLFHAQRACVCGVYVVVGTRGCRAHLILQRAHVLHLFPLDGYLSSGIIGSSRGKMRRKDVGRQVCVEFDCRAYEDGFIRLGDTFSRTIPSFLPRSEIL